MRKSSLILISEPIYVDSHYGPHDVDSPYVLVQEIAGMSFLLFLLFFDAFYY